MTYKKTPQLWGIAMGSLLRVFLWVKKSPVLSCCLYLTDLVMHVKPKKYLTMATKDRTLVAIALSTQM